MLTQSVVQVADRLIRQLLTLLRLAQDQLQCEDLVPILADELLKRMEIGAQRVGLALVESGGDETVPSHRVDGLFATALNRLQHFPELRIVEWLPGHP